MELKVANISSLLMARTKNILGGLNYESY